MQDVKSSRTTFINRTQQCFAVKSGVDGILDLARSTFCRVTEQVHELVDKYKTDYGMDALKVHSVASTAQHSTAQHSTAQHSTCDCIAIAPAWPPLQLEWCRHGQAKGAQCSTANPALH